MAAQTRLARLMWIGAASAAVTLSLLTIPATAANTSGDTIAPANSLAKGLTDKRVATVGSPTDLAFTPDGRALITTQTGQLRVLRRDGLVPSPALDLSGRICDDNERGLLGVAVDPDFGANQWIYLFWTFDKFSSCRVAPGPTPVNRVTRFRLGARDHVASGSARVIVDNIPSPTANHNAGDLAFGADGMLYITTGDGRCEIGAPADCGATNDNSRRLDLPLGKVLRVTPIGDIPADNPYVNAVDARRCTAPGGPDPGAGPCTETYASGFRNPFRMGIRPGTSTPWVNDVGQDTWEEINKVDAGSDYGWNVREGFCLTGSTVSCDPGTFSHPVFSYRHSNGCGSITGGAFVPPGTWNGRFARDYMFADFLCGSIWRLHRGADGSYTAKPLAPAAGPVALTFGPSRQGRALYYGDYFSGQIRRITPS
ncbi:MAG: PQQ-dependent sugar dehydrogenase [Actinomycetia bacterium]|nr:PQQ-dependent sugar dehydrogenase [Actinomycetes bacterium]